MKVRATSESTKNNIEIAGYGIVAPGTILEIPEERFKTLSGNNVYGLEFVKEYKEPEQVVEEVLKEVKPKKKPSKKKI